MHSIQTIILLDKDSPLHKGNFSLSNMTFNSSNHQDLYMILCAKALGSLGDSIQKTKLSLSLLRPNALDAIASNDAEKSELIQLWVENSIIRVQSIYDRALILVNRVFDLGLANESISHNTIVCNEHIERFGIKKKLQAINQKCKDYKNIRNTVIHHDRYTEEQLGNLTLILSANYLSKENNGTEIAEKHVIDKMVQEYLSVKTKELTDYLDKIEEKINLLYDALIPVYQNKKSELSE